MNFIKVIFESVNCYDDYLERLQKALFDYGYILSEDAEKSIVINSQNYNPLNWNFKLDKKPKPYILRLFSLEKTITCENCYTKLTPFGVDIFTDNKDVFSLLKTKYINNLYSVEYKTIEEVVIQTLKKESKTLACAESCTAGMISSSLVNVAGSSSVFLGGFVVYSNDFKTKFLNVDPDLIKTHGAVSEEVVRAMALGCLEYTDADIAIAVSGIAGPGGSEFKPQGLTYMAIATDKDVLIYKHIFDSDRNTNRRMTTAFILFRLLKDVLNYTL